MDFQSRLKSDDGVVTSEAALAMVALLFVTTLLVQALFVAVSYVRLAGLAQHAGQIASASGDPLLRANQARDFVRQGASSVAFLYQQIDKGIEIRLMQKIASTFFWHPQLIASSFHVYIDEPAT